jgi:preprotein translocase subunit SecA
VLQFLTRIFGSRNQRLLKGYGQVVRDASALEPAMQALSDEQLRAKTDEVRRSSSWRRKRLPRCARHRGARSVCATSTCS